jgi:thiol:disulfide interchange protein DsbC
MLSKFSLLRALLMVGAAALGGAYASFAAAAESAEATAIRKLLTSNQPNMVITSVVPSPVAGLYEVVLQDGQAIYVSADAQFLIPGDMYQALPEGLTNLGEKRRNVLRKARIEALDEKDMIVFEPAGGRKATITVFTDVDCPYCRKLHGEISALNAHGIAVRYLAFPRTGLIDRDTGTKTETYVRMVATWCAEDRKAMLTSAKRGADVPAADCDTPVEEQYELGREVGVTGTPALVLEDGTILPGYIPADTLAGHLLGTVAE